MCNGYGGYDGVPTGVYLESSLLDGQGKIVDEGRGSEDSLRELNQLAQG